MSTDPWWPYDGPTLSVERLSDPLCQCQGCGAYASISKLGEPHNCHRNEDGTYEEGGTFQ